MANVGKYFFPGDLYYDKAEHLWLRPDGGELEVGMDALALDMVGELVHLDLAQVGTHVRQGDILGTVEAEKMVRPLKAPVAGVVTALNESVLARPLDVNDNPYQSGWLLRLRPDAWDGESSSLLTGEDAVSHWLEQEVAQLEADKA